MSNVSEGTLSVVPTLSNILPSFVDVAMFCSRSLVFFVVYNLQLSMFEALLPTYYGHGKFSSFTRQLNYYGMVDFVFLFMARRVQWLGYQRRRVPGRRQIARP